MTHAVSRLRAARLARSSKPFLARRGPGGKPLALVESGAVLI